MNKVGKVILIILVITIVIEIVILISNGKEKETGYFVYNEEEFYV